MPVEDEVERVVRARVGNVIRGKYTLDGVLGVGGMGAVYVATHRNRKQFAIKMLHPELSLRESIRSRFLREGYVANSVGHPGAVAVLDDDVAEDGSAFLVMELLQGMPVDALAANNGGRLGFATVLDIASQALEVLAVAHANGIVHRDLKPANLFLTSEGRLKVLDFGIARLREAGAAVGLGTQTGAMMGTPAYMAPEQAIANASEIDAQTDLWALGATMFELLCGQLVHVGSNAQQLLIAAGTRPARLVRAVAPEIPAPVAVVVDRALCFEKRDRWSNAMEMGAAVASALSDVGVVITSVAGSEHPRGTGGELGHLLALPRTGLATPSALGPTWDVSRAAGTPASPSAHAPAAARAAGAMPPSSQAAAKSTTTSGLADSRHAPPLTELRGSRRWAIAVPVALVAAVLLAVGVVGRHGTEGADVKAASAPQQTVSVAAPEHEAPPVIASASAPPPTASVAVVRPVPQSGAPRPVARPPSARISPAAAAATGASKPKPDCDPPYTLDANGIKHAKLECL